MALRWNGRKKKCWASDDFIMQKECATFKLWQICGGLKDKIYKNLMKPSG